MSRAALFAAAALFLAAFPAPAPAAAPCGDTAPDKLFTVLKTPQDAAALPPGRAVRVRIEGPDDQRTVWPSAALRKLQLAPGSTIGEIQIDNGELAGWSAPGVRFVKVDLSGVTLGGSDLTGACFDHAILKRADFSNAKLRGARFDGTDLAGARFDGADLSDATLDCSPGFVGEGCYTGPGTGGDPASSSLSFRGADLRRADIARPFEVYGGDLENARLDRTSLAFSFSLLADIAKAKTTSIAMLPPDRNSGAAETFGSAELMRLRQLSGGNLNALIRKIGDHAGFDCSAPRLTRVEKDVCADDDLTALDQLMTLSYRRWTDATTDKPAALIAQRSFLLKRNACVAAATADRPSCISDAYIARLSELGRDLAAAARPAGKLTLEDLPAVLAPEVRSDPLAARLLRVYGLSPQRATLEPRTNALFLNAASMGSNGHSCGFEGELHWDAAKRAWANDDDTQPILWLILPDGIALASPHEEARQWCGARAGWPEVYFVRPAD